LALHFSVQNAPNAPLWDNDRVLTNGTYLQGYHILPRLGVREAFLSGAAKRAAFGLGPRPTQAPSAQDSTFLGYAYTENNADRILYSTTVSTDADQQALSMGQLRKQWTENDRNYFHYSSDGPVTNTISWLSGRYALETDLTAAVPVQYHHHGDHAHELPDFQQGIKAGLDLNTELFGQLAYDTLKMVEFPIGHGSHATLNGNLIPTSESYLLCDVDHANNDIFNVPFFVGAHEVAHYWWGHRVDPANVPGGRMMTEGLADYLGITAVGRRFGDEAKARMVANWRKLYFRGRAGRGDEVPLVSVGLEENQDYLNYRKAALAFNALAGYLGEANFHTTLAAFEARFRHAEPPYATALDLVAALRSATPDSLAYLIEDYFEAITLYDNGISNANITPTADGGFAVKADFFVTKYRADAKGEKYYGDQPLVGAKNRSIPLADYVWVACYAGDTLLARQKVKASTIDNTVTFSLPQRPDRIVLDPDGWLLDANDEDGTWWF
ncbi:MAG: M1 family aminopeptidase, partial [Bacteroidota bacterium]